jgi:GntR family transcriptional repressor for pyruvate dehydrogenase complex
MSKVTPIDGATSLTTDARPLVARITDSLREEIEQGEFEAGERLSSETELARQHSVSRAVIREAIAILRSKGIIEVRRGVGAFVAERVQEQVPFSDLSLERISSVIELIELRLGFETEAASLAAARRSATQLEAIFDAHRRVGESVEKGEPTRYTDFNLHLKIAEATQNSRFPELMMLVKAGMVAAGPKAVSEDSASLLPKNPHLQEEHGKIVNAILRGSADDARSAMRAHLEGSLDRYKNLLLARIAM